MIPKDVDEKINKHQGTLDLGRGTWQPPNLLCSTCRKICEASQRSCPQGPLDGFNDP